MNRIGFVLKVRPDLLEDYKRHHQAVWPEMLALRRNGWHNYTLFLRPDGTLFGYFETEGSLEEALVAMPTRCWKRSRRSSISTEVSRRCPCRTW